MNLKCGNTNKDKSDEQPVYASLDSHTTYVGIQTCRECHQSIYDSFIQTGMGKSFDVASKSKSSGNFEGHPAVYDKYLNFWYQPFWKDDSLHIMEYRMEGKDTVHKRVETVSYIIGSGQHTNSHIMNTSGFLNQMPLTFYTQKGTWDLPPGFEHGGNSRFSRIIGLECMSCHNSYPEFILGSENRYDFVERGINCERCHGPGSVHVSEKRSGKIIDVVTGIDYSIVNPAKLPIDRQLDVCQRCHIQGNAVLREGKSFFDFRPGMKLSDVMDVYMPVYAGRENEHIMASHVERLKMSRCFNESLARVQKQSGNQLRPYKDAMTCVTCHNPHVSVRQTDVSHFNSVCNSCHITSKDGLCTEQEAIRMTKNNDCVSCHMPSSGATDIPHVAVHDHKIGIPVAEEEIKNIKRFTGISCLNNPEPGPKSKGRAFIAYFEKFNFGLEVLDSAKAYFPSTTKNDINQNFSDLVHIAFLEKKYSEVIRLLQSVDGIDTMLSKPSFDNCEAWTAYRVGESFVQTGDEKSALIFYKKAYTLAPGVQDFLNKYATTLVQMHELEEAKKILERGVYSYDKYPPTLSNLGYLVLIMDRDTSRAGQLYDRAIAMDPDYEQAVLNKAGLLVLKGKHKAAAALLSDWLKKKPGSLKARELLREFNSM